MALEPSGRLPKCAVLGSRPDTLLHTSEAAGSHVAPTEPCCSLHSVPKFLLCDIPELSPLLPGAPLVWLTPGNNSYWDVVLGKV